MKSSEYYQQVFEEVFNLLIERECNTRGDFSLLNDWLMGYPQGFSDGRYVYKQKFYPSREEMPDEAKEELERADKLWLRVAKINSILGVSENFVQKQNF